MDKTTQDLAWRVLPKEFKEEVKETYREYTEKIATTSEPEYRIVGYIAAQTELELLFGKHNLTSDAEGEETLICEKSKVQRAYNTSREIVKAENPDSLMYSMHTQIMCVLENIFGSECLPDEDVHEDNFTSIEPKPAEPKFKEGDKAILKGFVCTIIEIVYSRGSFAGYYIIESPKLHDDITVPESDLEPYSEPKSAE